MSPRSSTSRNTRRSSPASTPPPSRCGPTCPEPSATWPPTSSATSARSPTRSWPSERRRATSRATRSVRPASRRPTRTRCGAARGHQAAGRLAGPGSRRPRHPAAGAGPRRVAVHRHQHPEAGRGVARPGHGHGPPDDGQGLRRPRRPLPGAGRRGRASSTRGTARSWPWPPTRPTTRRTSSTASARSGSRTTRTRPTTSLSTTGPSRASTPRARRSSWSPPSPGCSYGLITPTTPFDDTGLPPGRADQVQQRQPAGLRRRQPARAITVSSDTYFYNIGANLWNGRSQLRRRRPAERGHRPRASGRPPGSRYPTRRPAGSPMPESRKELHDANPKAFPNGDWFTGDNVNTAIGQGDVAVTPLQLANAYATFANGGTVLAAPHRPRSHHRSGAARSSSTCRPCRPRHIDLPAAWRAPMLAGFEGVVADGRTAPPTAPSPASRSPPSHRRQDRHRPGPGQAGRRRCSPPSPRPPTPSTSSTPSWSRRATGRDAAAPVVRRIYDGLFNLPLQPVTLPKSGVD